MDWFNEMFDLAAIASGAGLAGGGGAAAIAWTIKGAIVRFIIRTLATAVITGIGFYFLLGALGFQIVPEDDIAATPGNRMALDETSDTFQPQASRDRAEAEDDGKTRIIVKSPFRKDG